MQINRIYEKHTSKLKCALYKPIPYYSPDTAYVSFIDAEGINVIGFVNAASPYNINIIDKSYMASDCAIAFETYFIPGPNSRVLYSTSTEPSCAHVSNGELYYRKTPKSELINLDSNVEHISMVHGWTNIKHNAITQGMVIIYTKGRDVYVISVHEGMYDMPQLLYTSEYDITSVDCYRSPDYRVCIVVGTPNGSKLLVSDSIGVSDAGRDDSIVHVEVSYPASNKATRYENSLIPTYIECNLYDDNTGVVHFNSEVLLKDNTLRFTDRNSRTITLKVHSIDNKTYNILPSRQLCFHVPLTLELSGEYATTTSGMSIPTVNVKCNDNIVPKEPELFSATQAYNVSID